MQESSIEYFLGQTIMKLRMVPKDVVQYRHNGDDVKFFLTKSGEKKLGELMKDEHPLQDIKEGKATDVEIIGITKQTGKNLTYQVRWKEKVFDKVDLEAEYTMAQQRKMLSSIIPSESTWMIFLGARRGNDE